MCLIWCMYFFLSLKFIGNWDNYKIKFNCLKVSLDDMILKNQDVFVGGKQVQDNIFIAQEAFHYLKKIKYGDKFELALTTDMTKTYDWVGFLGSIASLLGDWLSLGAINHAVCYYCFWHSYFKWYHGKLFLAFLRASLRRIALPILFYSYSKYFIQDLYKKAMEGHFRGIKCKPKGL